MIRDHSAVTFKLCLTKHESQDRNVQVECSDSEDTMCGPWCREPGEDCSRVVLVAVRVVSESGVEPVVLDVASGFERGCDIGGETNDEIVIRRFNAYTNDVDW